MFMYVKVHVYTCVNVEDRGQSSAEILSTSFEMASLIAWSSPITLTQQGSKSEGSSCLCLPALGLWACVTIFDFLKCELWRLDQGPHAFEDKDFINGATPPAPAQVLLKESIKCISALLRCEFDSRSWLVSKLAGFIQGEIHTYATYLTLNHSHTVVDTLRANGITVCMGRLVNRPNI